MDSKMKYPETQKSTHRKTSAKKELAQTFYEMRIYAEKNFGKTMTDTSDPKRMQCTTT